MSVKRVGGGVGGVGGEESEKNKEEKDEGWRLLCQKQRLLINETMLINKD